MTFRQIVVSSRAMGRRDRVTVKVYDTLAELRAASEAYNGGDDSEALGVTQVSCRRHADGSEELCNVTIRLARDYLGTQIVSHEMHHASAAIYGDHIRGRVSSRAHLNHYNEPFAHLFSDLLHRLVDRLYELGYYPSTPAK